MAAHGHVLFLPLRHLHKFNASTLRSDIILLRAYPKIGVGVYRTTPNFSKRGKRHSDRWNTSRKDVNKRQLQIYCCFAENPI